MKYDLVRPCKMCPFRTDCLEGWLGAERASQIVNGVFVQDKTFACHETTQVVDEVEGDLEQVATSQHCAGALILAINADLPFNQLTRVAERTATFDHRKLDLTAPVFDSTEDFVAHHAGPDYDEPECCSVCSPGCEAPAGYMVGGTAVRNTVAPDTTYPCPRGCGEYVCSNCEEDCWCREGDDDAIE